MTSLLLATNFLLYLAVLRNVEKRKFKPFITELGNDSEVSVMVV
jgi:hypothetical protein